MSECTPKQMLKEMAKDAGVTAKELLVLSAANDPFNCGGNAQIAQAEWFANVWRDHMPARGHLRKLHYKLVSGSEPILKPDGSFYRNTERDWGRLQTWSKFARYLGMIDPQEIVDQRNPDPHLFAPEPIVPERPGWDIEDWFGFDLPSVTTSMWSDFSLPKALVTGYQYDRGEQPYLLELWVEKSTMDQDLIPICRQLGMNLVTSTGFQSVTGAIAALSRAGAAAATNTPVRIFYLSDFDPAGDAMPVAVSRQIEFWYEQFGHHVDIKLNPLVLTRDQIQQYNLPTIPIKDEDRRKEAFQDRHGVSGAVELDALEAIYPGELSKIIRDAAAQYRDFELEMKLIDAEHEAEEIVSTAWSDHVAEYRVAAEELKQRTKEITDRYAPKLRALSDEFNSEMETIRDDAAELESAVEFAIENSELPIELPHRPVAEIGAPDESHWLYASNRSFDEQLQHYLRRKEGR